MNGSVSELITQLPYFSIQRNVNRFLCTLPRTAFHAMLATSPWKRGVVGSDVAFAAAALGAMAADSPVQLVSQFSKQVNMHFLLTSFLSVTIQIICALLTATNGIVARRRDVKIRILAEMETPGSFRLRSVPELLPGLLANLLRLARLVPTHLAPRCDGIRGAVFPLGAYRLSAITIGSLYLFHDDQSVAPPGDG